MKKPTQKQIDSEIKKLIAMKPTVIHQSMFGDNHHDAIDAQVKVLEEGLDAVEIDELADEEGWAENVHSDAQDAFAWADGDRDESPSKEWQSLVRK